MPSGQGAQRTTRRTRNGSTVIAFVLSAGHGCMLPIPFLHLNRYRERRPSKGQAIAVGLQDSGANPETFETGAFGGSPPPARSRASRPKTRWACRYAEALHMRVNQAAWGSIWSTTSPTLIHGDGCQSGVASPVTAASPGATWAGPSLIALYGDNLHTSYGAPVCLHRGRAQALTRPTGWHGSTWPMATLTTCRHHPGARKPAQGRPRTGPA